MCAEVVCSSLFGLGNQNKYKGCKTCSQWENVRVAGVRTRGRGGEGRGRRGGEGAAGGGGVICCSLTCLMYRSAATAL